MIHDTCKSRSANLPFLLSLLLMLSSAGLGYGQAPADNVVAPLLWKIDPLGQGAALPTTCSPYVDCNGPLLIGDPLLDDGPRIPGWVAGVELGVVVPHVSNSLFQTVTRASGAANTVQLPSAQINAALMPRFEFGYRFGQAGGEVLVSYRFLTGRATDFAAADVVPMFAPDGVSVRSRLDLHSIDLDYGSWAPRTVLGMDMKWRVGVRMLSSFNDSQADNGVLAQSTANRYFGAGPHAMVDFRRPIEGTDLALFGRIEGAIVFGQLDQRYTESVTAAGITDFGQTNDRIYSQVTTLAIQAGVSWTPRWNSNFHVTAGYLFEHFFDLGSFATGIAAREELDIHGGFARLEWRY